jgi:hypothetical protein
MQSFDPWRTPAARRPARVREKGRTCGAARKRDLSDDLVVVGQKGEMRSGQAKRSSRTLDLPEFETSQLYVPGVQGNDLLLVVAEYRWRASLPKRGLHAGCKSGSLGRHWPRHKRAQGSSRSCRRGESRTRSGSIV